MWGQHRMLPLGNTYKTNSLMRKPWKTHESPLNVTMGPAPSGLGQTHQGLPSPALASASGDSYLQAERTWKSEIREEGSVSHERWRRAGQRSEDAAVKKRKLERNYQIWSRGGDPGRLMTRSS